MAEPAEPRAVRQQGHDIEALYGMVSDIRQSVDANGRELGALREIATGHTAELGNIRTSVEEHTAMLADHSRQLMEHGRQLADHGQQLADIQAEQQRQGGVLDEILRRLDNR
jgi:septal ring factor EnvC (AmiA/AmiB activator)